MKTNSQTKVDAEARKLERQLRTQRLQEQIGEQVAELANSDAWQAMLDFARRFHTYSLNNMLLILSQFPEATKVAGFRKWQSLGRQVRQGERGIKIFGFAERRIKTSEDGGSESELPERKVRFFPLLTVFDISQTDPIPGAEQPPEVAHALVGADEAGLFLLAQRFLQERGWPVQRQRIPGNVNGFAEMKGRRRVVIEEDLSPAQAAKTLLHEAAHVVLHADLELPATREIRATREVEAESVAYVVAGYFGLDTSSYTIGYVTGWSGGNVATIRSSAENVLRGAHELVEWIEESGNQTEAA